MLKMEQDNASRHAEEQLHKHLETTPLGRVYWFAQHNRGLSEINPHKHVYLIAQAL